jgi:uncharacterized membrane protein (DUF373 family)
MTPISEPTPDGRPPSEARVNRILKSFEHTVVLLLMVFLMVVVALTTLELGWLVVRDVSSVNGLLLLDVDEMFELFGFFLLVLIGMELLVTLKAFLYDKVIHVEVVLEVSLIAAAQKIIIMNTSQIGAANLLSLAVLVLALAAAFWVVRTARRMPSTRAN